jgi:hypothetical protein
MINSRECMKKLLHSEIIYIIANIANWDKDEFYR